MKIGSLYISYYSTVCHPILAKDGNEYDILRERRRNFPVVIFRLERFAIVFILEYYKEYYQGSDVLKILTLDGQIGFIYECDGYELEEL